MKIDKYRGYNDEMKYKEGVLTLLESLVEEVKTIKELMPKEIVEPVVEPVKKIKKAPKAKKNEDK